MALNGSIDLDQVRRIVHRRSDIVEGSSISVILAAEVEGEVLAGCIRTGTIRDIFEEATAFRRISRVRYASLNARACRNIIEWILDCSVGDGIAREVVHATVNVSLRFEHRRQSYPYA
jgi:hypothetical protein